MKEERKKMMRVGETVEEKGENEPADRQKGKSTESGSKEEKRECGMKGRETRETRETREVREETGENGERK